MPRGNGKVGNPPKTNRKPANGRKKTTPTPGMLGTGMASKAARAIQRRRRMLADL